MLRFDEIDVVKEYIREIYNHRHFPGQYDALYSVADFGVQYSTITNVLSYPDPRGEYCTYRITKRSARDYKDLVKYQLTMVVGITKEG